MDVAFTPLEKRILTRTQWHFPLSEDPYGDLAEEVDCTPDQVHQGVLRLRQAGVLRRIGGSFAAGRLGYLSTLVAARVDPSRIEEAADRAGAFPEVTHSYERDHVFNLWFTVIAADRERLDHILDSVRQCDGVRTLRDLPAVRLFKIRVEFRFAQNGTGGGRTPASAGDEPGELTFDDLDRRLIARACGDVDESRAPFRGMAAELNAGEEEILVRLRRYRQTGAMRRFGAVLRHRAAGFTANGMSVWDVPDAATLHAGEAMSAHPEVSHCYQRPRFTGWPYNLFAMIHGQTREACMPVAERIAREIGMHDYRVLFSLREFKKTSMVYFAAAAQPGSD